MEPISFEANLAEKPAPTPEDSEDKQDVLSARNFRKNKPIKKKSKSKAKETQTTSPSVQVESEVQSTIAPFGIFQSETQKCQRLDHYFRKDIGNFYKTTVEPSDYESLENLVGNNLIELKDVVFKDLQEVWGDRLSSLPQIRSYLELISELRKPQCRFSIFYDQETGRNYCCFYYPNQEKIYSVSQIEKCFLEKRAQFTEMLSKPISESKGSYQKSRSQLKEEIIFLYKILYDSTRVLRSHITRIQENIHQMIQEESFVEQSSKYQAEYINLLVSKLLADSLQDRPIDYLNFFKDNQIMQHNNGPVLTRFTEQRELEEFMRKKKNKKGRKGRFPLHSACLGCMSSYSEQSNPIYYCQECYVRFHRSCYAGHSVREDALGAKDDKDLLCDSCYLKKLNPNSKFKQNECDYCNSKGLLSVSVAKNKKIHILCMLLHGLWKVNNEVIQFDPSVESKNIIQASEGCKCSRCSSSSGGSYISQCHICGKYAHPSCAFLGGWKIQARRTGQKNLVVLKMQCCEGVPLAENERRRKFASNYKRYAYSF